MIVLTEIKKTELKNLKPGSFVLIDDIPCKVDRLQTSKPGKHGGAKARISASGIFTQDKKSLVKPASTTMSVPIIEKRDMQILSFIGDNVQLMDIENYSQIEIPVPEEFKGQLEEGGEVVVWVYGKYALIKMKK